MISAYWMTVSFGDSGSRRFSQVTLRHSLPLSKWAMQHNLLFKWPPKHYCHILGRCPTSPKGGLIPRQNGFLIPQPPNLLNHGKKVIPWNPSNLDCKSRHQKLEFCKGHHQKLEFCLNPWIRCSLLTGSS